ncbi:MAG: hypothetical protein ACOC0D_01740 [Spirochaeta sp.]
MHPYSDQDITQREAILRRLRHMLEQQRERFQEYLVVLDRQQTAINQDSVDFLAQQVEMETAVLEQIIQTQKTIVPLEQMYQELSRESVFPADISELQKNLTDMRIRISSHNEGNRARLSERIEQMRMKASQLRVPNRHASPYAAISGGQMVDIHG